jgi:hypothetical protein
MVENDQRDLLNKKLQKNGCLFDQKYSGDFRVF